MGHTLQKTELNHQRVLMNTTEKPTGVAEKLYFLTLQLIRENTEAPPRSNRVDSIKVMCPNQH